MPFPNDQFSFGTSKRFTKIFSGLMPGFCQKLGDARVERLLFIGAARVVDGDLNDHEIVVARDPQIIFAIEKIAFVVFVDRHGNVRPPARRKPRASPDRDPPISRGDIPAVCLSIGKHG
jgi:hypothetical protein